MSSVIHPRAAAALSAGLLLTGCAAGAHHPAAPPVTPGVTATAHPGHTPARPGSLAPLAAAIGCTAEVDTDADELRQGACRTAEGEFRMLTFATGAGRRAWWDEARRYGGTYLVGDRWTVTAPSRAALTALRGKLGGTVKEGTAHHPDAPSGPHSH